MAARQRMASDVRDDIASVNARLGMASAVAAAASMVGVAGFDTDVVALEQSLSLLEEELRCLVLLESERRRCSGSS